MKDELKLLRQQMDSLRAEMKSMVKVENVAEDLKMEDRLQELEKFKRDVESRGSFVCSTFVEQQRAEAAEFEADAEALSCAAKWQQGRQ